MRWRVRRCATLWFTMSDETPYRYTAALAGQIELAWQDRWEQSGAFHAPNPAGPWAQPELVAALGEKLLVLDMFPYPSGAGLHVGHPLGYIATDVFCRYHRMRGRNVLHALGYDAFGLPAEQYAVQTGQHPRKTTEDNIAIMQRQLRRLGLGFDERRSFATIDEGYYRWTQWIFLQIRDSWYDPEAVRADGGRGAARPIGELVEQARVRAAGRGHPSRARLGAAVATRSAPTCWTGSGSPTRREAPVNWCPGLGTVLSNEEVTNEGRSERGNFPVFRRNLRQWMMRITAYADRLADDLDRVDWPEKVKLMQRNWIGRSAGAQVRFPVVLADGSPEQIEVFTTRPDTLFGATFMVLAPEHPLVDRLVPQGGWPEGTPTVWKGEDPAASASPSAAVTAYRQAAARKSEVERQTEGKDKTGVFTGSFATNPVNGQAVPVFVADYVLMGYGTGAIMAVPGHDHRDFEYADGLRAAHRAGHRAEPGRGRCTPGRGVRRRRGRGQLARDRASMTSTGCPWPTRRPRSSRSWRPTGSAWGPSPTGCATGCSAGSATGASRSRSSSTTTGRPTRCRTRCCR